MRLIALFALLAGPVFAAPDSTNGWGYGLDSLDRDLAVWKSHPDVRIDSIGASVRGRPIWMVSITDRSDSLAPVSGRAGPKRRVAAHARTHPWEVQSQRVAKGMISALLEPTDEAAGLRRDFQFHIIPQYNPDGIVLGSQRFNANGIDLEGNWSAPVMEPEAASLKRLFQGFMAGANPVDVALNLHSDQFNCTRFFFYHLPGGTSELYAAQEKVFIADVQARFPGGIEDWNFVASWANAPVLRYPEGFWWSGWREKVMALTYEDANCPDAGRFDSTGRALVLGTAAYLRRITESVAPRIAVAAPLRVSTEGIHLAVPRGSRWELRDLAGRRLGAGLADPPLLPWSSLPGNGSAILAVRTPAGVVHRILLPRR
jgi:hypothetical protein